MPLALPLGAWALIGATFLAAAVESVEALTIVLAVGVTRGWRATLIGTVVALVVLALITVVLGPALTLIPIDALRVVIGTLLLIFGLQWLRKAVLRASGFKACTTKMRCTSNTSKRPAGRASPDALRHRLVRLHPRVQRRPT